MQFIWLLILGMVAGIAAGMFGIGGGAIIVPALIILLGFTQTAANGTSLAALLLPVGIFGAISYHRNNMIDWRAAMIIAGGLLFGAIGGAQLAIYIENLNPVLLKRIYGAFLIIVGWRMAAPLQYFGIRKPDEADETKPLRDGVIPITILGLIAGVASGMFGIGGGAVIVPILVMFMNFPQKTAVATSLAALLPPVAIGAATVYYLDGNLQISAAIPVALGLLAGAWFGAQITIGLPSGTVKRIYGIFLIVIALRFIFGS